MRNIIYVLVFLPLFCCGQKRISSFPAATAATLNTYLLGTSNASGKFSDSLYNIQQLIDAINAVDTSGAAPGGPNRAIQFNNSGVLDGVGDLSYTDAFLQIGWTGRSRAIIDSFGVTSFSNSTNFGIADAGGTTHFVASSSGRRYYLGEAFASIVLNGNSGTDTFTAPGGIVLNNKIIIPTGSNKPAGTATLNSGTVTVSNTSVSANSMIWVQYLSGAAPSLSGTVTTQFDILTIVAGSSFTIRALTVTNTTNSTDNSQVQYWIIN